MLIKPIQASGNWYLAVGLSLMICLCGCSPINTSLPNVSASENETEESIIMKETIAYPADTASKEECRLCGEHSLWGYYRKRDSMGVLNLANGQISDLEIFAYEEDGSLKNNSGYSSTNKSNDGEGRYCHLSTMGGRGICNIDLSWEEEADVRFEELVSFYCQTCMEKIAGLDNGRTREQAEGRHCPFAMIDFTTGELYSLDGIITVCFIRDYYIYLNFGKQKVAGVIVYAPERFSQ